MEEAFGENAEIDDDYFEDEISKKSKCPMKNIIFFILGTFTLLLIIVAGFLLLNLRSPQDEEEPEEDNKKLMISEINCTYYILDISSPVQILNDDFLNETNIILRVNGIEQNFSKYILFLPK